RQRIEREPGIGSVERVGLAAVTIAGLVAYVQRIRAHRSARLRIPVARELRLDVMDVRERAVACAVRDCEAGELREHERLRGLDADVRLRFPVTGPRAEPAVAVLERRERLDVGVDAVVDLGRRR